MNTNRYSLSPAQQQALLTSAQFAVARYARAYSARCGRSRIFTKEDEEDIVGIALLRIFRFFDKFDPGKAQLSTWVNRIALNCLRDALADKIKRQPISEPLEVILPGTDDEVAEDEVCDPKRGFNPSLNYLLYEYEADKEINRREFEGGVREQIARLSEKNQEFLEAMEAGDKPRDLAVKFGCTPSAAATRGHRIRQALREPLARLADEFDVHCSELTERSIPS